MVIWVKVGSDWPMFADRLGSSIAILCRKVDPQCFPFYVYNEDGSNHRENITDWALEQFRTHYKDKKIGKWDIFHYVYGVLHHPGYRENSPTTSNANCRGFPSRRTSAHSPRRAKSWRSCISTTKRWSRGS